MFWFAKSRFTIYHRQQQVPQDDEGNAIVAECHNQQGAPNKEDVADVVAMPAEVSEVDLE